MIDVCWVSESDRGRFGCQFCEQIRWPSDSLIKMIIETARPDSSAGEQTIQNN